MACSASNAFAGGAAWIEDRLSIIVTTRLNPDPNDKPDRSHLKNGCLVKLSDRHCVFMGVLYCQPEIPRVVQVVRC
jgi:hypothetical protein